MILAKQSAAGSYIILRFSGGGKKEHYGHGKDSRF